MARFAGLDPAVLDQLSHLSLVARRVVEGFMAGHHTSPHRGSSVEFAQHRPYASGDELKAIDWRVFARSDRLVVKEYVDTFIEAEFEAVSLDHLGNGFFCGQSDEFHQGQVLEPMAVWPDLEFIF